jgi:hypothetical protein
MSFWDILIITLGIAQMIVLVWVTYAVLRIKRGPVARFLPRVVSIVKNTAKIGAVGVASVALLDERVQGVKGEVRGIAEGVKYGTRLDLGDSISYKSLLETLATVRSARGMLRGGLAFLNRWRNRKAPPGPAAAQSKRNRRSLADRLGLVPPIARPLGRVLHYVGIARDVHRELRGRGIL